MRYGRTYKAVVFDLDNTLYDEDSYFLGVFGIFANKHDIDFSRIQEIFDDSLKLTSRDVFGDVLERLGIYTKDLQEELFELYKTADIELELYEDAHELIGFIKNKGLKTGILTNGVVEAQRNKIRCLSMPYRFDAIVFARQLGKDLEKPNSRPFKDITERLKIRGRNLLFIGDNPYTDFKGAKQIGGFTVRLRRGIFGQISSDEFVDMEIEDLKEIERVL
jgi:putative hydrolase of the HAD superfamily